MFPDATALALLVSALSVFLVGTNIGLLYRFWPEPWLSLKVIAVSGLLTYIALSTAYGHPAQWRVGVGLVAILLDFVALGVIWKALERAKAGEGVLLAYRRR